MDGHQRANTNGDILVPLDVVEHIAGTLSFRPVSREMTHALRYVEQMGREREHQERLHMTLGAQQENKRRLRESRLHEAMRKTSRLLDERSAKAQRILQETQEQDLARRSQLNTVSHLKTFKAAGAKMAQIGKVKVIARTRQIMAMEKALAQRNLLGKDSQVTLAALIDRETGSTRARSLRAQRQERERMQSALSTLIEQERKRERELRSPQPRLGAMSATPSSTKMMVAPIEEARPAYEEMRMHRPRTTTTPGLLNRTGGVGSPTLRDEKRKVERLLPMVSLQGGGVKSSPNERITVPKGSRAISVFESMAQNRSDPSGAARRWLMSTYRNIRESSAGRSLPQTAPMTRSIKAVYDEEDLFPAYVKKEASPRVSAVPIPHAELNDHDFDPPLGENRDELYAGGSRQNACGAEER